MGAAVSLLLIDRVPNAIVSFVNLDGNLIGEDCTVSRKAVEYSLGRI
jgi:hypothetical protein